MRLRFAWSFNGERDVDCVLNFEFEFSDFPSHFTQSSFSGFLKLSGMSAKVRQNQ